MEYATESSSSTAPCANLALRYAIDPPPIPDWRKAPDWRELQPDLHELTNVVPPRSESLERTTVLTWIYRRQGCMTFLEFVDLVDGDITTTAKKKIMRRALRGLERIGALSLFLVPSTSAETAALDDSTQEAGDEDGIPLGKNTAIQITRAGMTWMHRAFRARSNILDENTGNSLQWVHKVVLDEEEDGKGTEPHWIESLSYKDAEMDAITVLPDQSRYRIPAVSSVFDMHMAMSASNPPRKRTTKRK